LFIRPAVTELNVAMSPDENDWQMSIGLCKFSSKIEPACGNVMRKLGVRMADALGIRQASGSGR
jgi:hypothetical protein